MMTENKINNRLINLFKEKENILSIYFTAGFPNLNDTEKLIMLLQKYKVDLIEVGIPFSDSLVDGLVIQKANNIAIKNGMTIEILFQQLKKIKEKVTVPLVLMGAMNPIYQFGFEKFCRLCKESGVVGTIIPEMSLKVFNADYKNMYLEYQMSNIFMITPQTTEEKVRLIDNSSEGFIYVISSNSTTGNTKAVDQSIEYFEKIRCMNIKNPTVIGVNINEKKDFDFALKYSKGAIIGTAFINVISDGINEEKIKLFLSQFRKI